MRTGKFILVAMGFALPALGAAARPARWVLPEGPAHCTIQLRLGKRVGNVGETIVFKSALKTEDQCRRLAAMHEPNFNPEVDASKTVAYRWSGPRERRRGGKALARAASRKRNVTR